MNESVFFAPGRASLLYERLRDFSVMPDGGIDWKPAHDFVEELWRSYHPFADPNFLTDAKVHFFQRFWEMYLFVALSHRGYGPQKPMAGEGPDLLLMDGQNKVWVEAIAPTGGEHLDAIVANMSATDKIQLEQKEEVLLRFTGAIEEKARKYRRYCELGIVGPEDRFIIAINERAITGLPLLGYIRPWIKALVPIGSKHQLHLDIEKRTIGGHSFDFRDEILTRNGGAVSTKPFLDEEYAGISAVLHSHISPIEYAVVPGEDFSLFPNPLARNPISSDLFDFCHQRHQFDPKSMTLNRKGAK